MATSTGILNGQVAVVTGAARGIGEAVSRGLAAMGAHVVLVARDTDRLQKVQENIAQAGGQASVAAIDLRSPDAIDAFGKQVREQHGRCDVLVNNAGVGSIGKPLHELPLEDWQAMIETNLQAPYLMIRALAPLMMEAKSGHIIQISSLAGRNPLANGAAYAATKWGLNGLTYSVAEELRPHGIRVSVVAPGSVNTGFGGGASGDSAKAARKIQPADVAHVIEMLVTQTPQSFVSEVLLRPTQKP
jgi:NAD(P)-dependent dehydrogenase (short-subunit alcohol dehydrogenase family)